MAIRIGNKVVLHQDVVENYGIQHKGVQYTVVHIAWNYMPSEEFYRKGQPNGYHPGYDTGVGGYLYDLDGLPFSLYDWEVIKV